MQGDLCSWINIDNHELKLCFPNMLHMLELSQNLLSSYVILRNGYQIMGNKDGFIIQQENGGAILLVGHTHNQLSYMPLLINKPTVDTIRVTAVATVTSSHDNSAKPSIKNNMPIGQACKATPSGPVSSVGEDDHSNVDRKG